MRLEGKVALIAGAGGRQGTAVPLLFAREGARVFLAGRNGRDLAAIAGQVTEGGGAAALVAGDLTDPAFPHDAVDEAMARFGRIDVLYNNTGMYAAGDARAGETERETWDSLIATDLTTHFAMVRLVIPHMLSQGGGAIINVAAARPARLGGNVGYAAAKAGVIALTAKVAREYARDNIRANCICPTNIGDAPDRMAPRLPEGRIARGGTPDDVAYAAVFLASGESAWITGTTLVVDGGAEVGVSASK
jgi:NAD(P)-dependent dehydrogenase (short-subunit alcohol dehydrogenase family)